MTGEAGTRYGHQPLFGVILTPDAHRPDRVVELAVRAESAGLDLVGIADHQYRPGFLDAWTLLGWVAARTRRVSVLPDVANLMLRPPAGLARAAATLDLLSGGRVELGLGAGGHGPASRSEGGPDLATGERIDAFAEAVRIIRALTTPGPPITVRGSHHRVEGAVPGPVPAHPIGLWLGGVGPRMLRLVGRLGDGWIPSATRIPPEALDGAQAVIDRAARAAGRDPRLIRRLYNLPGPDNLRAPTGASSASSRTWAAGLAEIALRHGISGFLLFTDDPDTITRYGDEVAPAVRAALR
ncbi:MAG TPA: LLM class flavin-dependent oxidoreductase [Microlunatus sp.]|nr:LLM class flavin-dependent oxidoreductase [Microlunatus sp.]